MTLRNLACGVLLCALSLAGCGGDDHPASISEGGTSSYGGSGGVYSFGGSSHGGGGNHGGNSGSNTLDAGMDASSDDNTNGGAGGVSGGSGGSGPDAAVDPGTTAHFTVPIGGGMVTFNTPGGIAITFDFPSSALGADITFTPSTDDAIGWPAGTFAGVIKMEPDGLTFAEPVRVSLADGSLILMNFSSSPTQSAPDPLALATDGHALELTHFSSLAIVAPGQSCQSQSGWSDAANSQRCTNAGGGKTAYRSYGCKNYAFCYIIEAGCCVIPGAPSTGCHTGDTNLTLLYTRTDTNGGQYPYCAIPTSDAGPDGGPTVVAPYFQSYLPQALIAGGGNQELTLYGSNFDPNGSVFVAQDVTIASTWVSAGEVHATVPAEFLLDIGTLSDVGYANPAQGGSNRSNLLNIPIVAASSDAGTLDASSPDASSGNSDASIADAGVPPVVTDFFPTTLPSNHGDQMLTLYGSGFDPNGNAFYSLNVQATTTWINSGEVELMVPEAALLEGAAQTAYLIGVGYINPGSSPSNTVDVPIVDTAPDAN